MSDELANLVQSIAAVATPLAVLFVGYFINRTAQDRSETLARSTSWHEHWADDFLNSANELDECAGEVFMLFWKAAMQSQNPNVFPNWESQQRELHDQYLPSVLAAFGAHLELLKFIKFAPITGSNLSKAADQLVEELRSWISSNGGQAERFHSLRFEFNKCVRKTHAELLTLDN